MSCRIVICDWTGGSNRWNSYNQDNTEGKVSQRDKSRNDHSDIGNYTYMPPPYLIGWRYGLNCNYRLLIWNCRGWKKFHPAVYTVGRRKPKVTEWQNAAKSSTGLRTIAARIRNTSADLEELGEDMTEAKYDELVQKLTEFNVSLKDVNGEYRSTYDIMADIASKWDKMSSMQQAALATALSGTRQQAVCA